MGTLIPQIAHPMGKAECQLPEATAGKGKLTLRLRLSKLQVSSLQNSVDSLHTVAYLDGIFLTQHTLTTTDF